MAEEEHNQKHDSTPDAETELLKTKLKLETKVLAKQLEPRYWKLELLKAIVGSLTLVGIAVTLGLGLAQLSITRHSNDDERFDKAVTRLAGSTPTERLAGVVGLGLYLEPRQKQRHRATLRFLVNALAVEQDPVVRSELLDRLSQVTPNQVSQNDLDDALERLRDRNRALYEEQRAAFIDKLMQGTEQLSGKGHDETYIGHLPSVNLAPLRVTAAAIVALVKNGARTKDLSNIYCAECDFSGKSWDMSKPDFTKVADFAHADAVLDLSGTDFHGAILRRANFLGLRLERASFESADIMGANFAGADLADAKFTDFGHIQYPIQGVLASGHLWGAMFPDFTCANLSGADFTGSPLFGIYEASPNPMYAILHKANLTNTKLGQMTAFTASRVPPNYNPTPPEKMSTFLFEGYKQVESTRPDIRGWDDQLNVVDIYFATPAFRLREPIPKSFSLGVQLVFSNLASARNLAKSELPQGLKDFISRNQKLFSNSPHPTPCTPKT